MLIIWDFLAYSNILQAYASFTSHLEKTSMSILSDLDPQNNRIQANNSSASSISLWWLLALPLLLAGVVWWLYQTDQTAPGSIDTSSSPPGVAAPLPEVTANTANAPASDLAAGHAEASVFPNENDKGSAVILSSEGGMNNADASLPQAVSPPSSAVLAAASETKTPEPAASPAAKRAPKKSAAKAGKAKKTSVAANQSPQNSTEKAKERDVDIISTIVR